MAEQHHRNPLIFSVKQLLHSVKVLHRIWYEILISVYECKVKKNYVDDIIAGSPDGLS